MHYTSWLAGWQARASYDFVVLHRFVLYQLAGWLACAASGVLCPKSSPPPVPELPGALVGFPEAPVGFLELLGVSSGLLQASWSFLELPRAS